MKNKIKYAFGALLSMMLLLSACSKAEEPQQVSATEPKKEVKMREVEIEFTLDVEQVDELRAVYQKLDENGKPRTFITDTDHVHLRFNWLIARHSYSGDEHMGTLYDEEIVYATAKRVGRNQALYKGSPNIAFSAKVPMPVVPYNREMELTLVISVTYNREDAQDGLLKADKDGVIPLSGHIYSSGVIQLPIDIDALNPKIVLPRLQLKPEGNLLRFDLENNTSAPAQVAAIHLTSNAFAFANPHHPAPNNPTEYRSYLASYWAGSTLRLPDGPITVAPGDVKSYYLHVRPRTNLYSWKTYTTFIRALGPNSELYDGFYKLNTSTSAQYLQEGGTQSIKLRLSPQKALTLAEAFPGGHLPLAYMAEGDMVDTNTVGTASSIGALLSYQDLGPNPNAGVTINQPGAADIGYYLPSSAQMTAAFKPITYVYDPEYGNNSTSTGEEIAPLSPYGLQGNYHYIIDNYATDKHQGICMLRFIGNGNRQLTAYRYTLSGQSITIEARYLGPTFTGTFDDIANDEFWAKPDPNEVVRTFNPFPFENNNETAYFLLTNQESLFLERAHYSVDNEWAFYTSRRSGRGQVRLFMRNPPQK